ncbi:2og-fe oxygenase [Favolaschia claudopus]|uniref:2og-fe oxygenase n=1 Tax=Favolaschia claudopus TaxID=2862362 RepID=A0AAW0CVQ4_9AGAR
MKCAKKEHLKPWETDRTFSICPYLNGACLAPASEMDLEEEDVDNESESDSERERERMRRKGYTRSADVDIPSFDEDEDLKPEKFFEKIFSRFNFKGSLIQTQRYSMVQASNPCLELEGIGILGLPPSTDVAQDLLSNSAGMNRLEVPAEKFRITNLDWDSWLRKQTNAICTELAGKKAKPIYKLTKLVLEGATEQSRIPDETTSNGAIASMTVLLPSLFQGGDLTFTHGIQSKTVSFASQSHLFTSIAAAYSVTRSAFSPPTSGYRLSLHYEIHNPENAALSIPPFPDLNQSAQSLRRAMINWKERQDKTSEPLAFFLQRKYLWDGLDFQALAGQDALLMTYLLPLARELNFQLCLVHVELTRILIGRYYPPENLKKVVPSLIDDEEVVDDSDETRAVAVDMDSIPVDLTGFNFRKSGWGGWEYLNGDLDDVEPEKEYEVMEYNIRTDETYHRGVVLLWPMPPDGSEHPVKLSYDPKDACAALFSASSLSEPLSFREKRLLKSLKARYTSKESQRYATRGLYRVAELSKDVQLLKTVLKQNHVAANVHLLGVDLCVSAYQTFGWDALKDFYHDAVRNDTSNPRRQALVDQLGEAAKQRSDLEVVAWCEQQREPILDSLCRSKISEVDWLLDLAASRGMDFMRTKLYPQLIAHRLPPTFWIHFVHRMKDPKIATHVDPTFVHDCTLQASNNLFVVPEKKPKHEGDPWTYDTVKPTKAGLIMEVIRLCIEADTAMACTGIFERMKHAATSGTLSKLCAPWECYAELIRSVDAYLTPAHPAADTFVPFFREAAAYMLAASEKTRTENKLHAECAFVAENLVTLEIAIRRAGVTLLRDCDMPSRNTEEHKLLIQRVHAARDATEAKEATVQILVRRAIDGFDTKTFDGLDASGKTMRTVKDIVDMFQFCAEVGARSEWPHLLARLEVPPRGAPEGEYVSRVLSPFLPLLRDYLESQRLDLETAPFTAFARNVARAFGASVMSQEPKNLLVNVQVGCKSTSRRCNECSELVKFFRGGEQSITFKSPPFWMREHLVEQMEHLKGLGVTYKESKRKTQRIFEIIKPHSMLPAGLVKENERRGKELLAVLGDQAAQRRILGSDYETILAQISRESSGGEINNTADTVGEDEDGDGDEDELEMVDDEEENGEDEDRNPPVKRGRGRPQGSKNKKRALPAADDVEEDEPIAKRKRARPRKSMASEASNSSMILQRREPSSQDDSDVEIIGGIRRAPSMIPQKRDHSSQDDSDVEVIGGIEPAPKRKRGRPPKPKVSIDPNAPARKRGRPRKKAADLLAPYTGILRF